MKGCRIGIANAKQDPIHHNHGRGSHTGDKRQLRKINEKQGMEQRPNLCPARGKTWTIDTTHVYMVHFKSTNYAAIVMEYLPGKDMNQLRETIVRGGKSRRLHVQDAVYLTADVFLPLLQRMHSVGVIHRDVKPSNAVRIVPTMASAR